MPGLDDAIIDILRICYENKNKQQTKQKLRELAKEKNHILLKSFIDYLAELQGSRTVFQSALSLITAYKEIDNFLEERNKR